MDELTAACLLNMGLNFLPQHKPWLKYRCTWRMQRNGQDIRSWTEYILGADCRLFQSVAVRDTRHLLDHYMVLGFLMGDLVKEIMGYLCIEHRFPLCPLIQKTYSQSSRPRSLSPLCVSK